MDFQIILNSTIFILIMTKYARKFFANFKYLAVFLCLIFSSNLFSLSLKFTTQEALIKSLAITALFAIGTWINFKNQNQIK